MPSVLRSARFRLAALYVAVFAASALVMGTAIFFAARTALQQQMRTKITTETTFLRNAFQTRGLDHLLLLVRERGKGASALDYLVQTTNGAKLAGEIEAIKTLQPGWTTIDVAEAEENGGRAEHIRVLVSRLNNDLLLTVGDDLGRIAEVEEAIASAFLWTVGLAAALGIAGGTLVSRKFLARVDAISRTAEAIIGGDLARRIPLRGTDDDLDRLAGTLNRMLDRIGILMDSLRQVSSDVAHDLRTPLSRLYQRLEDTRTHANTVADYQNAVEAAVLEAESLLETFAALLRIAQVEGTSPRAGFHEMNLGTTLDSVVDAYRPDAEEAGHPLIADIAPGIVIRADQELLTQAISNLIENALRHTPAGTRIEVQLFRSRDDHVHLIVQDNGPGVTDEDRPRLVNRFYRGERSRSTPGNGLGLSLVAAVADLHGAKLRLEDAKPGLRATIDFPPESGASAA
jgi:signal transduction histidine kinase